MAVSLCSDDLPGELLLPHPPPPADLISLGWPPPPLLEACEGSLGDSDRQPVLRSAASKFLKHWSTILADPQNR